ncbi:photosystem reaction center subunit H [Candidatus Micrarchaeota archaeon]|nr:photosystem reaction center subunit H [Candidatus Micrarchaeota archaeon]MBD3418066.1 photosystem reaction center subunit H [Candidatus Micrarchaeota archaeon]
MGKYTLARQLSGKKVITNDGEEFGRLVDVDINEITGKIEELIVEPNPDNPAAEEMRGDDGLCNCPYDAVLAVGDFVIIEKRSLKHE